MILVLTSIKLGRDSLGEKRAHHEIDYSWSHVSQYPTQGHKT